MIDDATKQICSEHFSAYSCIIIGIIIIIIFLCKMSHPCSKGYFFVYPGRYLLYVYTKTTFLRETRICY